MSGVVAKQYKPIQPKEPISDSIEKFLGKIYNEKYKKGIEAFSILGVSLLMILDQCTQLDLFEPAIYLGASYITYALFGGSVYDRYLRNKQLWQRNINV